MSKSKLHQTQEPQQQHGATCRYFCLGEKNKKKLYTFFELICNHFFFCEARKHKSARHKSSEILL
jgi:hypothetical protein